MIYPLPQRQMNLDLRDIRCTAEFSDDWDWPFNPKNSRSRRRRFAHSGERITGFTAVFCDDWKDWEEQRDKASAGGYARARPQSSQSRPGHESCTRKKDTNDLDNREDINDLSATNPRWQRQHGGQSNIEGASASLQPAPSNRHTVPDLTEWWPLPPATLEDIVPSFTTSVDDRDTVSIGPATPSYSTPRISGLPCPMPVDMDPHAEAQWSQFPTTEYHLPALTDLITTGRGSAMPSTEDMPDYRLFLTDGSSLENGGFDYWGELLECNTSLDSWCAIQSRDGIGKSAVEHNSQDVMNSGLESEIGRRIYSTEDKYI
ncbi:hypothetical protein BGZ61DRAFT_372722 [Ilyonectria robusta]|uniref:uncharacterized protein n=1 Tax=Ilyonectria robusta TaxID=1079257 RepID=UPI001E8CE8CD|nr:uncharacterized protein BGZ61DRAFT_372722 [Ilyonectria robusta]KAH8656293.1 hypothetical protein BGZ61DRAFT_372722 [Ilyonectria robusta]